MKFEFSAGGIVFRKSQKGDTLILVCQHSQHHGWVFPKGLIGDRVKGEGKEETAIREVREETGILGKIIREFAPVTYWYQFRGDPSTHSVNSGQAGSGQEKVKKTVYYFLMEYVLGDTKNHDFEMENVEWLPMEEVLEKLTYKSDKEVWKVAKKLVTSN